MAEKPSTFLYHYVDEECSVADVLSGLESSDTEVKQESLRQCIRLIMDGEKVPRMLMTVIRFCLNDTDHGVKKLLILFWEVVDKYDASGALLPEMILVCNALRNDLISPNEFIRGATLRFLCTLKEPELLQPLVPSVEACLEHRQAYVRRNAVLTLYSIYQHSPELIPDAPAAVERFLATEYDVGARRNAFLMLFHCDEARAVRYLLEHMDAVPKYGDGFQLVILELARKVCRSKPAEKAKFIRCIFQMLKSPSAAVAYEAAWTLVSLSSAPTAIRAACQTYTVLLTTQSDNNIKLIVLDRLEDLRLSQPKILQELLMDILRVLSSPNPDIQKKTLALALELVTPKNIGEVVGLLKKEIMKTQEGDADKASAYRALLIKTIHACAVKFPAVADSVVPILMDFLNREGAMDVVRFVRAILHRFPDMRRSVLTKLMDSFPFIRSADVFCISLWILAEYVDEPDMRDELLALLKRELGEPPFLRAGRGSGESKAGEGDGGKEDDAAAAPAAPALLADGTYASQSAIASSGGAAGSGAAGAAGAGDDGLDSDMPRLRALLMSGDFFLATAVANALTKIALRWMDSSPAGAAAADVKAFVLDAVAIMSALPQLGSDLLPPKAMDAGAVSRIAVCIRTLLAPELRERLADLWLRGYRASLARLLAATDDGKEDDVSLATPVEEADGLIIFRQLRGRRALGSDVDLDDETDIRRAVGEEKAADFQTRLNRVYQMTGIADPVYCEAFINVHEYDILMELHVTNRTTSTLTELTVELATMGDLKLVDRMQSYTLAPGDEIVVKANIKVSSTDTGSIFGSIVYNSPSSTRQTIVNLNDIAVEIMDYILPATCSDIDFRTKWAEFEWENKVGVHTSITSLKDFLQHIVDITNMRCLTPTSALEGDCAFLTANLYAKSIFGEDALANLSIELKEDGKIIGNVRIRSKTQGIALSLGDRITSMQLCKK
eukprot:PLAT7442.1.p1 GENE.PLAT7442.1~~PLAT7442.1.p1  ORF type:complete len:955 (-),score=589.89 PLAT7442.1:91-2955(-)